MMIFIGIVIGAVGMLAALLLIGSIEWDTTYYVVEDKSEDK